MKIRKFDVTCDHINPKYQVRGELIEVRSYDGRVWFWDHPKFGCSKDYSTPELAIDGMLQDHACRLIRITPTD